MGGVLILFVKVLVLEIAILISVSRFVNCNQLIRINYIWSHSYKLRALYSARGSCQSQRISTEPRVQIPIQLSTCPCLVKIHVQDTEDVVITHLAA